MDILNLFQKQTTEMHLREKLRQDFESSVEEAIDMVKSDPSPIRELVIQAAIVNFYKSMKESELIEICNNEGIDFQSILEEEYKNTLNKYLK